MASDRDGTAPRIDFRLQGPFRACCDDRSDCTPRAAKAQGLLALLLTAPEYRRSRSWLQDKLWSDRDQQRGADSLRQALVDIRRAFGPCREVLRATRSAVWLDPDRVGIQTAAGEFLEGIDIRDAEFEVWLAVERQRYPAPATEAPRLVPDGPKPPPLRRAVLFETPATPDRNLSLAQRLFVDVTGRSIAESLPVDVLSRAPANTPPGLMIATVEAFMVSGGALGLRICLEEADTHRILWAEIQVTPGEGAPNIGDPRVMGLSNRLVEAIAEAARNWPRTSGGLAPFRDTDAARLALQAVEKIFSLRAPDLEEAERLLHVAIGLEPRGLFYGWLAQLYSIQFVERFRTRDQVLDKAQHAAALALELDQNNSNVLATVSNARLVLEKDLAVSGELARMGVDANPANPLARWSLASAQLYYGRAEEAHATAHRAQMLAMGSRFRFWSDFQKSLTAAVTGRALEAIQMAEAAAALRPQYRPPLRYLIALYAGNDMEQLAAQTVARLQRIEPDFDLDRMVRDEGYPVSLMRTTGLLPVDRLRAISA